MNDTSPELSSAPAPDLPEDAAPLPAPEEVVTPVAASDEPMAETLPPEEDTPPPPPPASDTVGKLLRAGRERANLSVAEVAHALKFSVRQVELLEADNYAALPGNTVVRGFVRGYARVIGMEADALLRVLGTRAPSAVTEVRPPENMGVANSGKERKTSPWLSVLIVLLLTAVLLALWHFLGPEVRKTTTSALVPGTGALQNLPAVAPEKTAEAPVAQTGSAGAPAVPMLPLKPPELVFVFHGRSWLEVSDAARQVLHTGENPAGGQITLTGKPPYDIVVGNSSRVKLTYGEREIDLAPHTRADVARLKLE